MNLFKEMYFSIVFLYARNILFIPRRESAPRGPIEYSFHFIGIGNGSRGFKNTNVNRPFLKLENVLFDGGGGGHWFFFRYIYKNIPICEKYTHLQNWVYFIYPFEYTHYFEKMGIF